MQPPGVEYLRRERYWRVHTPERADYACGNLLVLEEDYRPGAIARWLGWWRVELGACAAIKRILLLRESADLGAALAAELAAEAGQAGLALRRLHVLSLARDHVRVPARISPLQPRLVRTGDDWDQVLALACDELTEENPGVVDFWRWRQAGFRDLALRGLGQWWGVWDGPVLVASAGFFGTAPWGRFQEVVTRASHRRQGICAGLCSAMVRDYFVRVPEGTAIIVAEAGSQAEAIYRRLGFRITHVQWELCGDAPGA